MKAAGSRRDRIRAIRQPKKLLAQALQHILIFY